MTGRRRSVRTLWTALLVPLALLLSVLAAAPAHAVDDAHLKGTVTGPSGPLESVEVTAYTSTGNYAGYAYTSATGAYDIGGLPAGTYKLGFVDYSGTYINEFYSDKTSYNTATGITLTADQVRTGLNATLNVGATIAGTVTAPSGAAAPYVNVNAYRLGSDGTSWDYVTYTSTAVDGTYQLAKLTPGTYRVAFIDYNGNYVTEYYADAATLETATSLTLTTDQARTGVNAQLSAGASITGKLTNAAGTGLSGINATLYQYDTENDYYGYVQGVSSDASGVYKFTKVPAGTYRIGFIDYNGVYTSEFFNNKATVEAADDVVVAKDATVTGKNALLATPGTITGTVSNAAGSGLSGVTVTAYKVMADGTTYATSTTTSSTGAYTLGGLAAATYRLMFADYTGTYVTEYWNDKPSLETADGIAVAASATVSGKNAVLAVPAKITGKVTNVAGSGIADVAVTAYRSTATGFEYANSVRTSSTGTYSVGGLRPGSYRLLFQDYSNVYVTEYWDDKPTLDAASDIAVAASATVSGKNAVLAVPAKITGTVTNAAGAALPNISVTAYAVTAGGTQYAGSATTNSTGGYTLGNLPPGTYRLMFQDYSDVYVTEYWNDKATLATATDIPVATGATVSGTNAVLAVPAKISGKVTSAAGTALEGISIAAYKVTPDGPQLAATAETSSTGVYTVTGLDAGTYTLGFFDYDDAYADEYWDDEPSLGTSDSFAVAANATVGGKNAVLTARGRVTGKVTNAAGAALPGIEVTAYNRNGYEAATATTSSSGYYNLAKLAPGGYRIGFSDPTGAYAPEYLTNAVTLERAVKISVPVGSTVTGKNASLLKASHITGSVVDGAGAGIAGIEVTAYGYDSYWQEFTTTTTASGSYDLTGLSARTYRLGFADPNGVYIEEYWNNQTVFARSTNVGVAAETTVASRNAALAKPGKISGKVTDAAGTTALSGVGVDVYELVEGDWDYVDDTYTSATGTWTVSGLRPGKYHVCFGGTSDRLYLGECWKDAVRKEAGTDITVSSSKTTTGINGTLAGSSAITGKVTDTASTPAPIANALVTVYKLDDVYDYYHYETSVYTSSTGYYSIKGLTAGSYRLKFSADGFTTEYYNNKSTLAAASTLTVAANATSTGKNAALAGSGRITGAVTTTAGAALADAGVSVYRLVDTFWQYERGTSTAADGTYEINRLDPGTYRLKFEKAQYLPEFWDDKPTLESATSIPLTTGGTVSEKNAALASGGGISGKVTNAGSLPLYGVRVDVLTMVEGTWGPVRSAYSGQDGTWKVDGLGTGTYRLRLSKDGYASEYYNNKLSVDTATDVAVTAGSTVTGRNAALALGGRVTGHVTDAAGVPIAYVDATAYKLVGSTWVEVGGALTDDAGRYEIGGLPAGAVRIEFDTNGEYTTEYWNDKGSLATADDVTVTAGATTTGKDAVLTTEARITGRVTDANGNGIPGVRVTALPEVPVGAPIPPGGYTSVRADGAGYYDLRSLTAGTYTLVFADPDGSYATEYWDNQPTRETATSFDVVAQTSTTKNAVLAAAGHLTGTLTATDGTAAENTDVYLYRRVGSDYVFYSYAYSRDTGLFFFDGLASGTYKLGFSDDEGRYVPEYWDDVATLAAATPITVGTGATVTGRNAQLAAAP